MPDATLRSHLEAIRRITKRYSQNHPEEPVYQHAVAALAILDTCPHYDGIRFYSPQAEPTEPMHARLVPDPERAKDTA